MNSYKTESCVLVLAASSTRTGLIHTELNTCHSLRQGMDTDKECHIHAVPDNRSPSYLPIISQLKPCVSDEEGYCVELG